MPQDDNVRETYANCRHSLTTNVNPEVKVNNTMEYDNGNFSDKFPFCLRFGMREFQIDQSRYLLDVTDINLTFEAAQRLYVELGNAIFAVEVSNNESWFHIPDHWLNSTEDSDE